MLGPGYPNIVAVSAKVFQKLAMDISARMQVEEGKFAGEKGVLFIYKLRLNIFRLYGWGSELNITFLQRKMVEVEGVGDRDVVARSVRSFVKTLIYFEVIRELDKKLLLNKALAINEEQAAIMLQLWARELRRTPQLDLSQLPPAIFVWFTWPDLRAVALKYNGELWDFQHRMGGQYLVVYA